MMPSTFVNRFQNQPYLSDTFPDLPSSLFSDNSGFQSGPLAVSVDPSLSSHDFFGKIGATGTFGGQNPRSVPEANNYVNVNWFVGDREEFDVSPADFIWVFCEGVHTESKHNFQRYRWVRTSVVNKYFISEEGRSRFGPCHTPEKIQEWVRFAGVQATEPKPVPHCLDSNETIHFAKRARVGNVFLLNTKHVNGLCTNTPQLGDHLFFIFRRYKLGENDNLINDSDLANNPHGIATSHLRWEEAKKKRKRDEESGLINQITNQRTREQLKKSKKKYTTTIDKKEKWLNQMRLGPAKRKGEGEDDMNPVYDENNICPYYWRIDAYHHSTLPGIMDYMSFHPRDFYVGWVVPVGILQDYLTKKGPDYSGQATNQARMTLYGGEKGYEAVKAYTELPNVEIMLGC